MKTTRTTIAQNGRTVYLEFYLHTTVIYERAYKCDEQGYACAIADAHDWTHNKQPTRGKLIATHL